MAIVGEAHVIVRAITTGFQKDIDDAMNGITSKAQAAGASLGKSFSSGATSGLSATEKQALQTYKSINRLIEGSYYMQAAIGTLAPAIVDLVGGLFALGSQAAAAAPALIVLPGVLAGIGQAAIAAKLAFSGVGKAIGALNKKAKGGGGIDKMPGILSKFASAQERVADSNKRVTKAYEALTEAQDSARESLQQLNFDAEDAAIAEKKAAIDLAKARETLQRVQDLPPNSAARKEAELAYAEADLNLRRAKDRNADLTKETEKRNAAGVEGSKEVLNAQENVTDAEKAQKKAIIELAKAQKELDDAKAGKGAGGGGAGADPTAGLSKEAAHFAKYIADLKPKFDELKASAGKDLFPALEIAVGNLATNLFPKFNTILGDTGKQLGLAAIEVSKTITSTDNLKNLDSVAKTNKDTIGKLGGVMGSLYSTILSLLSAAGPLITRFTDWAAALADTIAKTTEAKNKSGELTGVFDQAGDIAAQFGDILKNIGSAFMDMGKAAAGPGSGGQLILDYFEKASEKFKEFTSAGLKDGSLEEYFKVAAENFTKVFDILGKITGALGKLGGKKDTGNFLDSIGRAVEILAPALEKLTEGGAGGAFGKFIEQVAQFLAATSESGSIKVYFTIMTTALGLLNKILTNPMASKLLGIVAAVHGGRLAFGRFGKAIDMTKDYLKGSFVSMKEGVGKIKSFVGAAKTMKSTFLTGIQSGAGLAGSIKMVIAQTKLGQAATKAWAAAQKAFNAVMNLNPFTLWIIAIVAIIAIVVVMYKKFEWFRDAVHVVFDAIKTVIGAVWTGIKAAFDIVWDAIKLVIELYWNLYIKPIFLLMLTIFKLAWDGIKIAFDFVWDAIKASIDFVWNKVIKPIFEAFGSVFSRVWDGIKGAFSKVWDFITGAIGKAKDIFGGLGDTIKDAFKTAFNFVADIWNKTIGKIGFKAPSWLGGWEFSVPDIPKMAKGGVVQPRSGGMTAIIGEAGRPERVEPLDPDGLSKRDKAMITLLSGGAVGGGINITVNPSPGMDEVELAALVNRQISFQLRRGAA